MAKHTGGLTVFYIILITQTISLVGSRMTAVAVGIWVFKETGSTTPLLLAVFFAELPGMLAGSVAGVLVDRWDRRRVLMLSDAGQAAGTLLLLASFLSGRFELWHLYAVSLLQGCFAILQGPARDAATTLLVPKAQRERANGIQQMSFPLAGVVAPVLAGTLYTLAGVGGVIFIDLATFLVAVSAVALVSIPRPAKSQAGLQDQGNMWSEMRSSFRYVGKRRVLLLFVLYGVFMNFMLNGPLELAIPYLIARTGSEAAMGGIMGLMSLGALCGAGLIAVWGGTRPRMHTLMPGILLSGLMFLVYGTTSEPWLLGASIFFLILPLPIMGALSMSILQVKIPPDMQGRIFGLVAQLGFLGSTTSFLLTGPLVDRFLEPAVGSPGWQRVAPLVGSEPGAGMGLLLVITGCLIFVVTLGMYAWPAYRNLEAILPDYEAAVEVAAD